MATPALVTSDLEKGQATLDALKAAAIPIRLAIWGHFAPAEEWRLVIVTPVVTREGPHEAYKRVQRAISGANALPLQRIVVVGPDDPLAQMASQSVKASGGSSEGPMSVTTTTTSSGTSLVDIFYLTKK